MESDSGKDRYYEKFRRMIKPFGKERIEDYLGNLKELEDKSERDNLKTDRPISEIVVPCSNGEEKSAETHPIYQLTKTFGFSQKLTTMRSRISRYVEEEFQ